MGAGMFPIENITVGGGTAFNNIVAQLLATLAESRASRAQVGTDVFSQLLGAETAARRRPVNIVDQLLLAGEFGSVMPLSQVSGQRLAQLGGRTSPALGDLFDIIREYAAGANPPQEPTEFQRGGSMVADPRRARTSGAGTRGIQAAAPVRMVDRNQRTIGVAGEAGRPERLDIEPLPIGLGGDGRPRTQVEGEPTGSFSEGLLAALPRDVRFRLEEFMRLAPQVDVKTALSIAQRPGDFEAFTGQQADPRMVAARLLAGGIQSDVRFQDPLVRGLALGRAPTSAQMGAGEFAALPPDIMNALIGVIGEDQLEGFLFQLQAGTPTGVRGARSRAVGGVRV